MWAVFVENKLTGEVALVNATWYDTMEDATCLAGMINSQSPPEISARIYEAPSERIVGEGLNGGSSGELRISDDSRPRLEG